MKKVKDGKKVADLWKQLDPSSKRPYEAEAQTLTQKLNALYPDGLPKIKREKRVDLPKNTPRSNIQLFMQEEASERADHAYLAPEHPKGVTAAYMALPNYILVRDSSPSPFSDVGPEGRQPQLQEGHGGHGGDGRHQDGRGKVEGATGIDEGGRIGRNEPQTRPLLFREVSSRASITLPIAQSLHLTTPSQSPSQEYRVRVNAMKDELRKKAESEAPAPAAEKAPKAPGKRGRPPKAKTA